jgi:hypothetical protein
MLLLLACWTGKHVVPVGIEVELAQRQLDEVLLADGVEFRSGGAEGAYLEGYEVHRYSTVATVRVEQWQRREAKFVLGPRERKVSEFTEERVLESKEADVFVGPYNGVIKVELKEGDWKQASLLSILQGRLAEPGQLPFSPSPRELHFFSNRSGTELRGAEGPEIYAAFFPVALANPGPADSLFSTSWSHWYGMRSYRIRLLGAELPELAADGGRMLAMFNVFVHPEPFVHVLLEGASLGCTPLLGEDLGPGYYPWDPAQELVLSLREMDRLSFVMLDEDLSTSGVDELGEWVTAGAPDSGKLGWLALEVEELPAGSRSRSLGSCSSRAWIQQPKAEARVPLATPADYVQAVAPLKNTVQTCISKISNLEYRTTLTPGPDQDPPGALAREILLSTGDRFLGQSDGRQLQRVRDALQELYPTVPIDQAVLLGDCVARGSL